MESSRGRKRPHGSMNLGRCAIRSLYQIAHLDRPARPRPRLPAPAPTAPPSAAPAALVAHEPDDQQEQHRADRGIDDRPAEAEADVDAELGQQPRADERSEDADEKISDDPEPGAAHDLPGQPSRDEADQ